MPPWIWIPITVAAAAFQTARNAFQRDLVDTAGPWGATLVRFLFGLPFAVAILGLAAVFDRPAALAPQTGVFLIACAVGATTQVLATAALMVSMRRGGFALGATLQQSSLPFTALAGLALGDGLTPTGWSGLVLATAGLALFSWPQGREGPKDEAAAKVGWSPVVFGLAAGAGFGVSGNAFRSAGLALAPGDPVFAAAGALVVVQAMQSIGLGLWLAWRDRAALAAALGAGGRSWGAGFCGAAASMGWFTAVAMAPAAAVRAVGVVDIPMAAWAGRRLFAERLGWRQVFGATMAALGVVAVALGHS